MTQEEAEKKYNEDRYKVSVICSNCSYQNSEMNIPKGKKVSECECPNCGCISLQHSYYLSSTSGKYY